MNTFTFTDDEAKVIKVALDQYKNNLAAFHSMLISTEVSQAQMQKRNSNIDIAINKLGRKPRYIIGECSGPELDSLSLNAGEMIRFSEDSEREQLIRQAITNNIGDEGWRPEDLIDRVREDVLAQSGSIYYLDDKPILEIYNSKAEITRTKHSEYIDSSFGYKFL